MTFTKHNSQPLIALDNITVRLRDRFILPDTSWAIKPGEQWAVIGPNGAGKTSLVRAIAGELPVVQGKIAYHGRVPLGNKICYVSFESHQRLIAREEDRDAARYFSGRLDDVTTARELVLDTFSNPSIRRPLFDSIVAQLKIESLLDRGIRFLSTGEMRKIMLAQALVKSPRLLILDEPFDGLDADSRMRLADIIDRLMHADNQIILVTHRLPEIPSNISHVLGVKDGRVLFHGRREEVLNNGQIERLYLYRRFRENLFPANSGGMVSECRKAPPVLVRMKNTTVRYNDVVILDNLNWEIKSGEHWAVMGPNGAGKTTLLSLISGDNLQAYANEVYLFGRRRGTGESIWDIKHNIGMVSPEFQIRYRKPVTAFEVVLSGFFDSVGLYRQSSSVQRETAGKWIESVYMSDKADTLFNRLSCGEQRLVLLARAMVKIPLLLLLDEPCQGLDRTNRSMIINIIDNIAAKNVTHIVYVTHHRDEMPGCITHMLRFAKTDNGGYSTACERLQDSGV